MSFGSMGSQEQAKAPCPQPSQINFARWVAWVPSYSSIETPLKEATLRLSSELWHTRLVRFILALGLRSLLFSRIFQASVYLLSVFNSNDSSLMPYHLRE